MKPKLRFFYFYVIIKYLKSFGYARFDDLINIYNKIMSNKNEEVLVSEIINNTFNKMDEINPLFQIAKELAKEIKKDIRNVRKCEYIGNNFIERGDLLIYNPNKIYVELKLITSSITGKGTLANTSQDVLKDYNLVKNVPGWKDWREEHKYKDKIIELLNNKINYTKAQIEKIFQEEKVLDPNSEIEIKGRVLRSRIKNFAQKNNLSFNALPTFLDKIINNKFEKDYLTSLDFETRKAIEVCNEIINLAREDLISYLDYCSKNELDENQFLKFIALIKTGFHTAPLIQKNINLPLKEIKFFASNYYTYYYYTKRKERDRIKKETPEKIKKIIPDTLDDLKIIFNNESIWIFNKKEKIIHMKFHWRNVFFGISTPSVEIFDLSKNHF